MFLLPKNFAEAFNSSLVRLAGLTWDPRRYGLSYCWFCNVVISLYLLDEALLPYQTAGLAERSGVTYLHRWIIERFISCG